MINGKNLRLAPGAVPDADAIFSYVGNYDYIKDGSGAKSMRNRHSGTIDELEKGGWLTPEQVMVRIRVLLILVQQDLRLQEQIRALLQHIRVHQVEFLLGALQEVQVEEQNPLKLEQLIARQLTTTMPPLLLQVVLKRLPEILDIQLIRQGDQLP